MNDAILQDITIYNTHVSYLRWFVSDASGNPAYREKPVPPLLCYQLSVLPLFSFHDYSEFLCKELLRRRVQAGLQSTPQPGRRFNSDRFEKIEAGGCERHGSYRPPDFSLFSDEKLLDHALGTLEQWLARYPSLEREPCLTLDGFELDDYPLSEEVVRVEIRPQWDLLREWLIRRGGLLQDMLSKYHALDETEDENLFCWCKDIQAVLSMGNVLDKPFVERVLPNKYSLSRQRNHRRQYLLWSLRDGKQEHLLWTVISGLYLYILEVVPEVREGKNELPLVPKEVCEVDPHWAWRVENCGALYPEATSSAKAT
ncbi:hypothetical protein T439DRAFT_327072 [Meredithblackwellia eburnea MCA 4105]